MESFLKIPLKRCHALAKAVRPRAICDLIRSAEQFRLDVKAGEALPVPGKCGRCGYISSQPVCKACMLLEGLNKGMPTLGVSRTRTAKGPKAKAVAAAAAADGKARAEPEAATNGHAKQ